ncbi:MAG: Verru_Chthon cassette protein B [Verrucomicrobiales bacterium]|jgi:uncharacterized protein (TIGR02598 family)|nr:Verru_Chthon cassette protein B [Verrucomicrobiales bacterium]
MKNGCRNRKTSKRAFSLVEVTLAIGIVSFAILGTLGTFSVGLTTIHDAKNDVAYAQIVSQVSSMVLQTPFDQIQSTNAGDTLYFDQAGKQLDNSSGAVYRAALEVTPGGESAYPGAQPELSSSAKSVQITVSTVNSGPLFSTILLVPKY